MSARTARSSTSLSKIPAQRNTIQAKILVLPGDADPLAPFDQVVVFRDERRTTGANWDPDIYGEARHSFMGEGIYNQASPEARLHPQSELRSWWTMLQFISEVLE